MIIVATTMAIMSLIYFGIIVVYAVMVISRLCLSLSRIVYLNPKKGKMINVVIQSQFRISFLCRLYIIAFFFTQQIIVNCMIQYSLKSSAHVLLHLKKKKKKKKE